MTSVLARSLGLGLALLLAGCAGAPSPSFDRFPLMARDGPPGGGPCPSGSIEGVLVPDETSGLGLDTGSGVRDVQWPPGYGAGRSGADVVLLDETGSVVAHVGDRLVLHGEAATWDANLWQPCRPVVLPRASG